MSKIADTWRTTLRLAERAHALEHRALVAVQRIGQRGPRPRDEREVRLQAVEQPSVEGIIDHDAHGSPPSMLRPGTDLDAQGTAVTCAFVPRCSSCPSLPSRCSRPGASSRRPPARSRRRFTVGRRDGPDRGQPAHQRHPGHVELDGDVHRNRHQHARHDGDEHGRRHDRLHGRPRRRSRRPAAAATRSPTPRPRGRSVRTSTS